MSHCTCVDPESQCAFCGLEAKVERLDAEVADLKARLKAARQSWFGPSPEQGEDWDERLKRVTDLRVKNWREP